MSVKGKGKEARSAFLTLLVLGYILEFLLIGWLSGKGEHAFKNVFIAFSNCWLVLYTYHCHNLPFPWGVFKNRVIEMIAWSKVNLRTQ
jgi:hypothetical protein